MIFMFIISSSKEMCLHHFSYGLLLCSTQFFKNIVILVYIMVFPVGANDKSFIGFLIVCCMLWLGELRA